MRGKFLLTLDGSRNEIFMGTTEGAMARATERLREFCLAKFAEVTYIRPSDSTWHGKEEKEHVTRIPQSEG